MDVRPVLALGAVEHLAVLPDPRVPVARGLLALVMPDPDAVLVEAGSGGLIGVGGLVERAELPLARDARGVARLAKDVPERLLLRVEDAPAVVAAEAVPPGHDQQARRRAQRRAVGVLEARPPGGELVQDRRPVRRAPVAAEALVAQVVGHDQQDVGPLPLRGGGKEMRCRRAEQRRAAGRGAGPQEVASIDRADGHGGVSVCRTASPRSTGAGPPRRSSIAVRPRGARAATGARVPGRPGGSNRGAFAVGYARGTRRAGDPRWEAFGRGWRTKRRTQPAKRGEENTTR